MGIASMVLGIVGLVISFIPCLGTYGIFLTVPGLVLGAVAIAKASKNGGAGKGVAIAGLVCSIIGSVIAGWQWYAINKASKELSGSFGELSKALESAAKDAQKNLDKAANDAKELDKAAKELDKAAKELDKATK